MPRARRLRGRRSSTPCPIRRRPKAATPASARAADAATAAAAAVATATTRAIGERSADSGEASDPGVTPAEANASAARRARRRVGDDERNGSGAVAGNDGGERAARRRRSPARSRSRPGPRSARGRPADAATRRRGDDAGGTRAMRSGSASATTTRPSPRCRSPRREMRTARPLAIGRRARAGARPRRRSRRKCRARRRATSGASPRRRLPTAPAQAEPVAHAAETTAPASYALPLDSLAAVAEAAGLQWVNSDAAKIEAAQSAMAADAPPAHVPREIRTGRA